MVELSVVSPPDVAFHGQFFDPDARIGEVLRDLLADTSLTELTVVVAWARYRGLARLEAELAGFGARGTSRIIVGIDEGGATKPGLVAARRLFTRAFVYHERGAGTFHPKLYLASGAERAVLIVGSSNATPGGLFLNNEASLSATFALPEEASHPALADAQHYIASLLEDSAVCKELTDELIDQLVADALVSADERPRAATKAAKPDPEAGPDAPGSGEKTLPTFGRSKFIKPTLPTLSADAKAELATYEDGVPPDESPEGPTAEAVADNVTTATAADSAPPGTGTAVGTAAAVTTGMVAATWSKVLPRGDAQQQANPATNLTGNIRLTKADHDIDWRTWFRDVLFAPPAAVWTQAVDRGGQPIETADVAMDVSVGGVDRGSMTFHLSHAPHRESGQANHTTVLHWGPLMATLTGSDCTGHEVTISRLSNGGFQLTIA